MSAVTRAAEAEITTDIKISGDWKVSLSVSKDGAKAVTGEFTIEPPTVVSVTDEVCERFPQYKPDAWGGWQKGYALDKIRAKECSVKDALLPQSLTVRTEPAGKGALLVKGKDYEANTEWGSLGRLDTATVAAGTKIYISYQYYLQRIDSVVLEADGAKLKLIKGEDEVCMPVPPRPAAGEIPVANIYVYGKTDKLSDDNLYPILEQGFPEDLAAKDAGKAEKLLPKTMQKLRSGEELRILAWGDSVTAGGFVDKTERWQVQFVERLKKRFPKANIELLSEAWGGHNTAQYLAEPSGAEHNYQEKVLNVKPDLIILEFVNDSGLKRAVVDERYGKFLQEFKDMGTEWLILTPHYIRPDWMHLKSQKNCDTDPREYVTALREFAEKNDVALADGSLRYGRLWRQGIPYNTLMTNNINHPKASAMGIFADALINLFPAE